MKLDVLLDEVLPHPIDDVWRELTDARSISDWLMPTSEFQPEVGATFRLKTERLSPDGWVAARVMELDPPRRMVWSWQASDGVPASTVTFELSTVAGGTLLRLTHVGPIDPDVGQVLRDGWPGRIALLRRCLDERA